MAERSISVKLKAEVSDFTREIARGATSLDQLAKKAGETSGAATTSLGKLAQSARLQSDAWTTAGTAMAGAGVAIAGIGVLAVREFAAFDQAMSGVASTGDDARQSIDALRDAAIRLGADTVFSATEAAQGLEELARAGVSADDALAGGLAGSLDLAAAGSIGVADAAGIASTAMTQFKLTGDQIPHLADLLAAGAGKAMGGVDDLGMAMKQGGLVASQFGLSIEETVGGLSAFAAAGLLGSDAGTAMKSMLLALANPSKESAQLMAELGINAYDASGQFVGLEGLAGQLQERMGGLDDATRQAALAQIFGTDAIRSASILYENGAAGVEAWTTAVNDSGYAAETAAIKQDNLIGDLEKLGGAWSSLAIGIGESANGPLRGLVQGLTDVVDAAAMLPTPVQNSVASLGGIAGVSLHAAGGVAMVVPKIAETVTAFQSLATTFPRVAAAAGPVGASVAIVGLVAGSIASDIAAYTADVGTYADMIREYGDVLNEAGRKRMAADLESDGTLEMADKLGISLNYVTDAALGSEDAIAKVRAQATQTIADIDAQISEAERKRNALDQTSPDFDFNYGELSTQIDALNAKRRDMIELQGTVYSQLDIESEKVGEAAEVAERRARAESESAGKITDRMSAEEVAARSLAAHTAAQQESTAAMAAGAEGLGLWTTAAQVAASGSEEAKEAYAEYIETVSGSSAAFIDLLGPMNEQISKSREVAEAAAADSASSTDSWRDFYDGMSFNVDEYLAELERQVEAQENWQRNMVSLASRVSQETLDTLAEMGPEAAPLVQSMVDMTDAELAEMEGVFRRRGKEAGAAFGDTLADAPAVFAALGLKAGDAAVENAAAEVRAGRTTLAGIVEAYDLEFLLDANTDPAIQAAYALQRRIESMTATMSVNARVNYYHANGLNAPVATGGYMADVAAAYGVEHLAGGGQARRRLAGLLNGPGSGVADLIPAMLSHREFVTNAQATSFYGSDFMYRLNRLEVPREALAPWRFADGGSPGYAPSAPAQQVPGWGSTTVTNVTQHVTQHLTFPGVNEVATIVEVVRDAARLNAQQGGDWTNG